MPPEPTRRSLLAAMGSIGIAGLAGCSGRTQGSLYSLPAPPPEPVEDLTVFKVRSTDDRGLFRTNEQSDGYRTTHEVIDTPADLDDVRFNPELAAATDLEEFVNRIDLDQHALVLHQQESNACMDHHLVAVAHGEDDLDLEFCQETRPADMACDQEEHQWVGFAIVLPFSEMDVSSFGYGSGRGCRDTMTIEATTPDPGSGGSQQ